MPLEAQSRMNAELAKLIRLVERSPLSSIRCVLNRIVEVASAPDSSAFDLKDAIETDPPLTARVLKRANSAFYAGSRSGPIADIHMAIVRIGFDAVKELALRQSISHVFQNDVPVHGYSRAALWEHCVATAIAGRLVYRWEYRLPGGQIHAAGLLSDIGIVVEDQCAGPLFLQALAEFERSPSLGLARCERAAMGFSHSEVGQALAQHWKFPPALCNAIGCESFPHPVGRNDESTLVAATVRLASLAVQRRRIGFVESPDDDGRELDLAMQSLGIRPRGLELILDEVEKEIERMRDEGWL